MIRERTLVIVKGSSPLGANFGLAMEHFRFLASNHTLSPFLKDLKPWQFLEDMTWQASLWVARASSLAALRDFRWVSTVGIEVSDRTAGRAQSSYPIMR